MKNRIERTRQHLRENRAVYLSSAVCLTVGVVGTVVLRDSNSQTLIKQGLNWKPRAEINTTVVNLIERSTPSKPVHLVGTNLYFSSMSEAARETGYSLSQLSKHINGHLPNVGGDMFELLESAT